MSNYENLGTWNSEPNWGTHIENGSGSFSPTSEYSDDGSDLYIPDRNKEIGHAEELLNNAVKRVEDLTRANEYRELDPHDIDEKVLLDAHVAQEEFQRRLDEMSEQDQLFSGAIQDWTIEELGTREAERGYMYKQGSKDSYLETIAVLDQLMIELTDDQSGSEIKDVDMLLENERLIEMVQMWRKETLAELTQVQLRELYDLAA